MILLFQYNTVFESTLIAHWCSTLTILMMSRTPVQLRYHRVVWVDQDDVDKKQMFTYKRS